MPVSSLHLIGRYTGAAAGDRAAAPPGRRAVGEGQAQGGGEGPRRRRRAAGHLRPARRAPGLRLPRRPGTTTPPSPPASRSRRRRTSSAAIDAVIAGHGQPASRWTGWSAATSASARPRWRCAPPSSRCTAASRWRCWCPPPCWPSSTTRTSADRFADWPVQDRRACRASAPPRSKAGRSTGLADGTVDIVIGTHKLLQSDVKFKNLGLVIIDEEHRFGVRQKERLKALRAEVDVLTLTATPIPRTLNMALAGLRDLSHHRHRRRERRLPIKTFVARVERRPDPRGRAARAQARRPGLLPAQRGRDHREHGATSWQSCCPRRASQVAHGQMRERELERVMRDFYHQRFNVLVCTTIIETGIDVPSANTIVINRADKLRPGPAAPAARPGRPLPPPGLCLPDRAAAARP